jgi:hypothetical protein
VKREKSKSKEQAQFNHPKVQEKVAIIKQKRKRAVAAGPNNNQKGSRRKAP